MRGASPVEAAQVAHRSSVPQLGHRPRSSGLDGGPSGRRSGLSRLLAPGTRPTAIPVRYRARSSRPSFVHIDVKKLGRDARPVVAAQAALAGAAARPRPAAAHGYDYLHVDRRAGIAPSWAYVEVHTDERGPTGAGFLRRCAEHLRLPRDPDRAGECTDQAKRIDPRRPRDFGAATVRRSWAPSHLDHPPRLGRRPTERSSCFNRTMMDELEPTPKLFKSNPTLDSRDRSHHGSRPTIAVRPHTALGGLPPVSRLQTTVSGNYT